jgi:hypothetical protein
MCILNDDSTRESILAWRRRNRRILYVILKAVPLFKRSGKYDRSPRQLHLVCAIDASKSIAPEGADSSLLSEFSVDKTPGDCVSAEHAIE